MRSKRRDQSQASSRQTSNKAYLRQRLAFLDRWWTERQVLALLPAIGAFATGNVDGAFDSLTRGGRRDAIGEVIWGRRGLPGNRASLYISRWQSRGSRTRGDRRFEGSRLRKSDASEEFSESSSRAKWIESRVDLQGDDLKVTVGIGSVQPVQGSIVFAQRSVDCS
jgi:hypothetical protein